MPLVSTNVRETSRMLNYQHNSQRPKISQSVVLAGEFLFLRIYKFTVFHSESCTRFVDPD